MSRTVFWYRMAALSAWGLLIWVGFRSQPLWEQWVGEQYRLTRYWCGEWGCSATMPRLLAWQLPTVLLAVSGAWLLVRTLPVVGRWHRWLATGIAAGTVFWMGGQAVQPIRLGQIDSAGDVLRYMIFVSVAGASVVIPLLLAALTLFLRRPTTVESRSNTDSGAASKEPEHFGDVAVPHVDAAT